MNCVICIYVWVITLQEGRKWANRKDWKGLKIFHRLRNRWVRQDLCVIRAKKKWGSENVTDKTAGSSKWAQRRNMFFLTNRAKKSPELLRKRWFFHAFRSCGNTCKYYFSRYSDRLMFHWCKIISYLVDFISYGRNRVFDWMCTDLTSRIK